MTNPKSFDEAVREAAEILEQYAKPYDSLIDNGNLYFAATVYQEAYADLREKSEGLLKTLEKIQDFKCSPTTMLPNLNDGLIHALVGFELYDSLEKARIAIAKFKEEPK